MTHVTRLDTSAVRDAVAELGAALGHDNVITSAAELLDYRDPYDYVGSDEHTGAAVVTPRSVEDVQAIVLIANAFRVPLWTFGQGRNYAYGGPAPRLRGSIQVSFREMNRVLHVDDELAYAVVEPGVRFQDLYDHLLAGGYRLWPSIPDLGWGSVVGNTLDSGRGYTRYGDHPSTQCGMEVVLANGELLRTGMGGMSTSKVSHLFRESYGPNHAGLFFQSNFGIVTKMGVWLMRAPEVYLSCWATWRDEDTTAGVVDALRELMFDGIITNLPLVGFGSPSEDGRDADQGGWMVRFALYGREPIVEAQYELAREALARTGDVEVGRRAYRGDEERSRATIHDDKVQGGVPGLELLEMFKKVSGEDAGHLDLSALGPMTGADVAESIRLRRELYARHGLPYGAGIILLQRCALHISPIVFDTRDEQATRAGYAAYNAMAADLARAGYPVYRTNIQSMDVVADQFDFGGHAQRRFNERLKDLLDPNGILSPGKQGIWPRHMRDGA
ncbi:MAG TPA: FAD-binding oxidoreductase [Trebonia sp.]|jgi:4-cresol dehydrogenase (hydroxylating)